MPTSVPYPYTELEFRKNGSAVDAGQIDALKRLITTQSITDLFIVSHGWNNDMDEARTLYGELFARIKAQEASVPGPGVTGRRFGVAGVLWPSKKFADRDLIPGGAAAAGDDAAADAVIQDQINTLEALLEEDSDRQAFEQARGMVRYLRDDSDAQVEFAKIFLRHLPPTVGEEGEPHIPPSEGAATVGPTTLLEQLGRPAPLTAPTGAGGGVASMGNGDEGIPDPAGGSAGIGDLFGGIKAGAMNLLNYVTYYQMKNRAGIVGRLGVNPAIHAIHKHLPEVKVHLIGHSFGARVVTSAVAGGDGNASVDVHTMTLLQAAFSHFSFSENYDSKNSNGFFRKIIEAGCVKGPLVISHTRNDTAVGIAYAVASRVAGQIAAAVGDANDPYGGLGSNGAQQTPEVSGDVDVMRAAGSAYPPLQGGRLYNLKSDRFITGHSEITNDAVAYAILTAVAAA